MAHSEEELKQAFKAFKKRLKLARLDDESGLAGGEQGRRSRDHPAGGHPPGIWEELVAKGKLQREMGGTYSLASRLERASAGWTEAERGDGPPRVLASRPWRCWPCRGRSGSSRADFPRVPFVAGLPATRRRRRRGSPSACSSRRSRPAAPGGRRWG